MHQDKQTLLQVTCSMGLDLTSTVYEFIYRIPFTGENLVRLLPTGDGN